jgi:hypothetical protein
MHPIDILETILATNGPAAVRGAIHQEAAEASLAGLAEFAAVRWSWWIARHEDLAAVLPSHGGPRLNLPALGPDTARLLVTARAREGEVAEVPGLGGGWNAGDPFMLFEERFKTALVTAGATSAFAHNVLGALDEMASNAVEHAGSPLPPVSCYEVTGGAWSFSVTDVGCGVLGSLRRNLSYRALRNDVSALREAVRDGVSCTGKPGRGHGFAYVFKMLVDRNCRIRFRSTAASAAWAGACPAAQCLVLAPAPERCGFHVEVAGDL